MRYILFTLLSLFCVSLSGGINFRPYTLDQAIQKAQKENKLVFVDTYATWCAPCKKMEKIFEEDAVGQYFNSNFINIRIDMDSEEGSKMLYNYEVVWLPTLLILDETGAIRNKVDKLIPNYELLELGRSAISNNVIVTETTLGSTPFQKASRNGEAVITSTVPSEEIVYVYDEKTTSARPNVMYYEAYLHLQLMDGKHEAVVKKYLSTQSDWSTEKNIKFIFDFVSNTQSSLFEYLVTHKEQFNQVVGKENVEKTIKILIQQRIEKGYPRPSLYEAKRLYSYLDPAKSEELAQKYFLNRLYDEGKHQEFYDLAGKYLDEINPFDHRIIYRYVKVRLSKRTQNTPIEKSEVLMGDALILEPRNPAYLVQMAEIYYLKKDKTKAIEYLDKARTEANLLGVSILEIDEIAEKVSSIN